MLVDNIRDLCSSRKISILRLETDCGFASGTINKWDRNTPSVLKVKAVADYFGVPMDDLLTDRETP